MLSTLASMIRPFSFECHQLDPTDSAEELDEIFK